MTTDNPNTDPYEAVLLDLRAKRDHLDNMIKGLEAFRGIPSSGVSLPMSSVPSATAEVAIEETSGMFLGMSIVDATKKLLALRKKTMGNVEISRELRAGGLILTGSDPVNVIGSVLTRRFNQVGDVVKVGRGIWGLKEWYPGRSFKPNGKAPSPASIPAEPDWPGNEEEAEAASSMEPNPEDFGYEKPKPEFDRLA
ncbi:winged helix-turn-helix domain-containing protein [Sphingobium sp.]|uniref:winged helix-turn-helix domain-containing protein n=1 Tax=Sphingobium sp. TaxID=1912891 RepID=UPI0028BD4994|nr:winged helix-turn-helix domain-containing protein [Sphingobium sp.]